MSKSFNVKILSNKSVKKIHDESLRILREVGVRFPHKELLEIFKEQGTKVDFENEVVKFPSHIIENAINIQRENTEAYYKKYEKFDEDRYTHKFFMSGGNIKYVIEPGTYKRREATLSDMLKAIVVGNALENVERVSSFLIPKGYDPALVDIIQFYLLALYSKKRYFFVYINSLDSAKCLIEMAKVIAEDEIQLKSGSLVEYELEPTNNLEFSKEHLDIAAEFAKQDIKLVTTHWCWMGHQSPMTFASLLTLTNTNILAGLAAIIALNPKNLFFRYIFPVHCVNKNEPSLPLMSSPNQVLFSWAARQLADLYGFKYCLTNSGFSDSIEDNFQTGFEIGVTAALAMVAGIDSTGVKGIHAVDQGVSLEHLIMDNEMFNHLNFIFGKKFVVNEETLDFESIQKSGIGGNFLYSLKNDQRLKEYYWDSDIFVASSYENWKKGKCYNNIKNKLRGILDESYPPKQILNEDKVKRLDDVIGAHVKDRSFIDRLKKDISKATKGSKGVRT
ncbi:MAG: hypothetical protein AMS17_16380 [Spirochaetes bacterium DG_61]|nr:MAG: hypothetical protein AMS17_16380 [Spirochaetes bacterium DG_61]